MSARLALRLAATLMLAGTVVAGAASASSPSVSLDVISWPGDRAGPLQWRLWRVVTDEPMQSVEFSLPAGAVRPQALRALADTPQASEASPVGAATIAAREPATAPTRTRAPLLVGGCTDGRRGDLATLRFQTPRGCANVAVERGAAGTSISVAPPPDASVAWLDLRLDSLLTAAGRLLPANPELPVVSDTRVSVRTAAGEAEATLRTVVGGDTGVAVAADRNRTDYGGSVTISGTVLRGGVPASGERVRIHPLSESIDSVSGQALAETVTEPNGRFELTLRPTSTGQLAALAGAAANELHPQLNTLAAVTGTVVVRAPRPLVAKRRVRRLAGRRVQAVIVVRNPIARLETLECRLYVGNTRVAVRRFPARSDLLVFRVVARRNAKVWVTIGRWNAAPIAGRSSRPLRLLPTSARARGSRPSRRR